MSSEQSHSAYYLSQDLTHLYHEFVEFHDACSCFCESLRTLLATPPALSPTALTEVVRFINHLQDNGSRLKEQFRALHQELHAANAPR